MGLWVEFEFVIFVESMGCEYMIYENFQVYDFLLCIVSLINMDVEYKFENFM